MRSERKVTEVDSAWTFIARSTDAQIFQEGRHHLSSVVTIRLISSDVVISSDMISSDVISSDVAC